MMTPEQIQENFVIPYDEAKRIVQEVRDEEKKSRKLAMDEIANARAFGCYGDEWGKVRTRPTGGDEVQTGLPAAMVELATSVVFDVELQATVRAVQAPNIDETQAQWFEQFALPLAVDPMRPQWIMELLGEMKSNELDTYRRECKLRPKAREAFRRALVDRTCILKDVVKAHGTKPLDVEVVIYGDEYFTQTNRDYGRVGWHIHDQYMQKAEFARVYPWIIERYTQGDPAGTAGFFQKYWKKQPDPNTLKKSRELQKPSIKVTELWYQMPPTDPRYTEFPGGFVVLTVFEDEPLRAEPNPNRDGNHPFHPIVPLPAEDNWAGTSWIYAHHDLFTGVNKTLSMGLANLVDACNNTEIWNRAAFVNPEELDRIDAGTRQLMLKHDYTWDKAYHKVPPSDISSSIFSVQDLFWQILQWTTGSGSSSPKQTDENGKKLGGDVAMGPKFALMMDAVKEQHETLFYNLCARGTQYSDKPRPFTVAGDASVVISFNPQFFQALYGDNFFEYFVIQVSESESLPATPEGRTADTLARMKGAAEMSAIAGLPLAETLAQTKPTGWTSMVRSMKRAEIEAAQNQQQQQSPEEKEKAAIQENDKIKTLAQIFQKAMQEEADDAGTRPQVLHLMATGQMRAYLEATLAGQPFTPQMPQQMPQPGAENVNQQTMQEIQGGLQRPDLNIGMSAPPLMIN